MQLTNIREEAPELGISETTLRRLIKNGRIPYRKIGKKYFFTEEDIQTYLSSVAVQMKGDSNANTK